MSRPSSRQNPAELSFSSPRRDGLDGPSDGLDDAEHEALLRSSLSLTSASTMALSRPLSPIAIRNLLDIKRPKSSSYDDTLGAWNSSTPRQIIEKSLSNTPPRNSSTSQIPRKMSSAHQPPSPHGSHSSMHSYPNQHKPANQYRNFIIDDTDPAFLSSATSPSMQQKAGSRLMPLQQQEGVGKRKPSLLQSTSFSPARAPSLQDSPASKLPLDAPADAHGPEQPVSLPPLVPLPPLPPMADSPSPPPSRPLSIASKVATDYPPARIHSPIPWSPLTLSSSAAAINEARKTEVYSRMSQGLKASIGAGGQGGERAYAFKSRPWWERKGKDGKVAKPLPLTVDKPSVTTRQEHSHKPVEDSQLAFNPYPSPNLATSPRSIRISSPPLPPPSRQSQQSNANMLRLDPNQLPLNFTSSVYAAAGFVSPDSYGGGVGGQEGGGGEIEASLDQIAPSSPSRSIALDLSSQSPCLPSHHPPPSPPLPPPQHQPHQPPREAREASSLIRSGLLGTSSSSHTIGALAATLSRVAKRSQHHISLLHPPPSQSSPTSSGTRTTSSVPLTNGGQQDMRGGKGRSGHGHGSPTKPCVQTIEDWELLFEKNRSRMMTRMEDLSPLLKPTPTPYQSPAPAPPLPSYASPTGGRSMRGADRTFGPSQEAAYTNSHVPHLTLSGRAVDGNNGGLGGSDRSHVASRGPWSTRERADQERDRDLVGLSDRSQASDFPDVEIFLREGFDQTTPRSPALEVEEGLEGEALEGEGGQGQATALEEEALKVKEVGDQEAAADVAQWTERPDNEEHAHEAEEVRSYPVPSWMLEGGLAPLHPPASSPGSAFSYGQNDSPKAFKASEVKLSWSNSSTAQQSPPLPPPSSTSSSPSLSPSIVPVTNEPQILVKSEEPAQGGGGGGGLCDGSQDEGDLEPDASTSSDRALESPLDDPASAPSQREDASAPSQREDACEEKRRPDTDASSLSAPLGLNESWEDAGAISLAQIDSLGPISEDHEEESKEEEEGGQAVISPLLLPAPARDQDAAELIHHDTQHKVSSSLAGDLDHHLPAQHEPQHEPQHESEHKPQHEPQHESEHKPQHEPQHESEHKPQHEPQHESEHKPQHEPLSGLTYEQAPVVTSGVDYVITKTMQPPWVPQPSDEVEEKERLDRMERVERQLAEEAGRLKAGAKAMKALGLSNAVLAVGGGGGGGGGGAEGASMLREIQHAPRGSLVQVLTPNPSPSPSVVQLPIQHKTSAAQGNTAQALGLGEKVKEKKRNDMHQTELETADGGKAVTQDIWA